MDFVSKANEIKLKINRSYSIFETDILHSELTILNWMLHEVCSNEIKRISVLDKKVMICQIL